MKQTAVEWLAENIDNLIPYLNDESAKKFNELVKQAKEMEKQQIFDLMEVSQRTDFYVKYDSFEDYYNEQFKNK